QYSESLHLNRRDKAVHDFVEVPDRQQFAPRHVPQVGVSGQEDGRRKLRRQMIRQVEVHIEAAQITLLLLGDLLDLCFRENLAARRLLRMWQGPETLGKEVLLPDFLGSEIGQALPGLAVR